MMSNSIMNVKNFCYVYAMRLLCICYAIGFYGVFLLCISYVYGVHLMCECYGIK